MCDIKEEENFVHTEGGKTIIESGFSEADYYVNDCGFRSIQTRRRHTPP